MPGAFLTSDLAGYFDAEVFGDSATYTHGATPATITVLLDAPTDAQNLATGEVEITAPVAWARTADVSSASHGDTLVVSGTTYYIIGVQPDGTGVTRLILSEDNAQ